MAFEKNQIILLTIESLSSDGNGVGRFDGQPIFVPYTAPGDVLDVKIVKACKGYAFGIAQKYHAFSSQRLETQDCPIFGKCGGCALRHLTYESELLAKQNFVADAMKRLGGLSVEVLPTLPSPCVDAYRNKVQYPLTALPDGTIAAGFYAGRSHRVIPYARCMLQPTLLNHITTEICKLLQTLQISVYDEVSHRGLVRHVYLRHAVTTGRVMVCLVLNGKSLPRSTQFCDALIEKFPQIETIVVNFNTRKTNVITGDTCKTLFGSGVLQDTMSGVPVNLTPLSFYQVNTEGANRLYAKAAQLANLQAHETLLDLYCGAGTIGLSMAHQCKKLIGVEIIPQAIESAQQNAAQMGITHAEFICGDAGKAAALWRQTACSLDLVIPWRILLLLRNLGITSCHYSQIF